MARTLVINPPFMEPHRPPISCAIISEVARLEGHEVDLLDINIDLFNRVGNTKFIDLQTEYLFGNDPHAKEYVQKYVTVKLHKQLEENFYDWILVSCFSDWEFPITELICKELKSTSDAVVVGGGPGLEKKGMQLVSNGSLDYHISGEGEIALKELFRGNIGYPGINGTSAVQIDDIEDLPLPNYDFFDFNKYDWLKEDPDVFIYGSRGCVRKCTFCDIETYWPKFRYRSGKSIANEMIANYEKYGVTNFYFADSLINGNLKEFKELLDILSSYKHVDKFSWGGYAIIRPKNQHPAELFDQMRDAGCKFMSIGLETGVDRIRHDMQKKFTNEDVDWHLHHAQRTGIQNVFLMITSWFDETPEEHEEYLKIFPRWQHYAADRTISAIMINPPLVMLPGTRLAAQETYSFEIDQNREDVTPAVKSITWINPKMPELSVVERYTRQRNIILEALKYNWNVHNPQTKLNEIISVLTSYRDAINK
jgi:radical SAM superfamily enzyme YgiQ (UPF0313 family)